MTNGEGATLLGRGCGSAPSSWGERTRSSTRSRGQVWRMATCNFTSIKNKLDELVDVAKVYQLDLIELSSTKLRGDGTQVLREGWHFFHFGVQDGTHARAGVGFLVAASLADRISEWTPVNVRVASM